jgi:hypothetical protein
MFWQLTIDCREAPRLVEFWAAALEYTPVPPTGDEPWHAHYLAEAGPTGRYDYRLFDPAGVRPPLFFQQVPEGKAAKNRLHLDLYPTRRDDSLSLDERVAIVDATVDALLALGASVLQRTLEQEEDREGYYVTLADPEGNEFCVS